MPWWGGECSVIRLCFNNFWVFSSSSLAKSLTLLYNNSRVYRKTMASEDGVFQGFGAWHPPPPSPLHVDPRIKLVLTKYVSFKLKSWKFSIHFYLTSTNYIHIISIILRKYCYIYIVPVLQKSTVTRSDMYTVHSGYVLKRPYRWTCLK